MIKEIERADAIKVITDAVLELNIKEVEYSDDPMVDVGLHIYNFAKKVGVKVDELKKQVPSGLVEWILYQRYPTVFDIRDQDFIYITSDEKVKCPTCGLEYLNDILKYYDPMGVPPPKPMWLVA